MNGEHPNTPAPLTTEQRVSILMTQYDELLEAARETNRLKTELTELRGLVGRAILSLQKGWSTAALDVLERSVKGAGNG